MKKRLLGLVLALALMFSHNVAIVACPGGGGEEDPVCEYCINATDCVIVCDDDL